MLILLLSPPLLSSLYVHHFPHWVFQIFMGIFCSPHPIYSSDLSFFPAPTPAISVGLSLTAMCREEPRESWGALGVWGRTATLNTWLSKLVCGLAELDTWGGKIMWKDKWFLDQFQTFPWQWLPAIPTASRMGCSCVSQTHKYFPYIFHSSTKKLSGYLTPNCKPAVKTCKSNYMK